MINGAVLSVSITKLENMENVDLKNEEQKIDKPQGSGIAFDDNYLADNIVEARTNHDKACEVYRNYVSEAETHEERLRRINAFRCGGFC